MAHLHVVSIALLGLHKDGLCQGQKADIQSCKHSQKMASPKFPVRFLISENIKHKQNTWGMLGIEFIVHPMLCC